MSTLTIKTLEAKGACTSQVERFRDLFGDSVTITPERCVEHAAQFDWSWAAKKLLAPSAYVEYEWVRVTAYAEYTRVCDTADAEYKRARVTAYAEYQRVCDPAYAEYTRVRAETFGRLYCAQEAQP